MYSSCQTFLARFEDNKVNSYTDWRQE